MIAYNVRSLRPVGRKTFSFYEKINIIEGVVHFCGESRFDGVCHSSWKDISSIELRNELFPEDEIFIPENIHFLEKAIRRLNKEKGIFDNDII